MNSVRVKHALNDFFVRSLSTDPLRTIIDKKTIDANELRAIGEETGRIWSYGSSKTIHFEEPELGDVPDEIAAKIGRHRMEEPFVTELRDCVLVGPHGVTITGGKYVLENALRSENLLVRSLMSTVRSGVIPRSRSNQHDETFDVATSMVGPWSSGYFHWFSEWLPRLEGIDRYVEGTGLTPRIILPLDPPRWMRDSLRFIGFEEWTEWRHARSRVDTLVVPSIRRATPVQQPDHGYTNAPDGYRWVRRRILDALDRPDGDTYSDQVYISRRKAEERRVVNEDGVMKRLEQRGFESYVLEEMSFEEQVRLFAGADTIVAPHGAGLVNTIYAGDAVVVELFGDYVNACYFTMSQGLDHEYACIQGEPVGPHLRVDVERLAVLLDQVE